MASRPVDKSAGHWGETSSTGLARFGDWREYARAKRAWQPLSCLNIERLDGADVLPSADNSI